VSALWPGPWPAEDGGPRRTATSSGLPGLRIADGERLETTAVRDALGTTMVVLRDPGEVFALRHTLGRRPLSDPVTAWVERLDPITLAPVDRSPELASGPFWPGGLAAHANGSVHVVTGNHCHRLSAELDLLASAELPAARPYNSFVVLGDGTLAMKDFDRDLREPARLVLLDPQTLERRCDDVDIGEPAIARLSADGNDLYVVGARSVQRWRWDGDELALDPDWGASYLVDGGSYGWDPVIAGGQLWFLDNGAHDFVTTMRGAGVSPGPVHLIRISLEDSGNLERVEVCGAARGAVTDPPLYDAERRIAVAYDSANGVVQAFRFTDRLEPLWRRELSHSAHMIFYPDSGELVLHDFKGPAFGRTRLGRSLMRRSTAVMRREWMRRLATRMSRDEVLVVDIETGAERGRSPVPTLMQSVVFPAPGFDRDVYWVTMTTIARVAVA
jgi:hypothetical protein